MNSNGSLENKPSSKIVLYMYAFFFPATIAYLIVYKP